MTAPPYMPLWIGDYDRDTMDFSTLEHGAYFQLLKHAWCHDATIPNDDRQLALITKMQMHHWKRIKNKILAKFVHRGSDFVTKRGARELAKLLKKHETWTNNLVRAGAHHKESNTTSTSRAEKDRAAEKKNGNGAALADQQAELPLPRTSHKQPIPVSDELKYLVSRPPRALRKGGRA